MFHDALVSFAERRAIFMMKEKTAKLVRKIALSSAKNAVNRKLILILHEPEVPEFVRKYMEKKEK